MALRCAAALVLTLGLCLLAAGPSLGAFPGRDGKLAYRFDDCSDNCSAYGDSDTYIAVTDVPPPRKQDAFGCSMSDDDDALSGPCSDDHPTWSPDGGRVAFEGFYGDGIQIGAPDGSGALTVPGTEGAVGPTWSPDGLSLAFAKRVDGQWNVYVVQAVGGPARRLTRRGGRFPAWSVRGEIAFSRSVGGRRDIFKIAAAGGRPRRLTSLGGDRPAWSPDGRRLVFDRASDPRHPHDRAIYIATRNGTHVRRVAINGRSPSWSPSGKRIAFERSGYIYSLELRRGRVTRIAYGFEPDWQPVPDH